MSVLNKWVKNISENTISVLGVQIQPDSFWPLPKEKIWNLAFSGKLETLIDEDKALLSNDGSATLSKAESLDYLKRLIDPETIDIKHKRFLMFQLIGDVDYDQYLMSGAESDTQASKRRRSGDSSNGYRYSNSAPLISAFTGKVKKAVFNIKGIAVSTGTPANDVVVNFELWKVGFQNEGTKLGDVQVTLSSSEFTIGQWWNASIDTNFTGVADLDIDIAEGDLLGLKFKRITGNSDAVKLKNPTVLLETESI